VVGFYGPGHHFHLQPGQAGSVNVRIKPSRKPMVVALTAYDTIHWKVALEPDANVAAVLLSGYHSHSIEGVRADIPLIKMSYDDGSSNYFYGYDKQDRDFREMLDRARRVTGLEVLTFQGSYSPLPGTVYRIRPAVPGDYKAVHARLDEEKRIREVLEKGRQRAAKDVAAGKFPPGTVEFEGHCYALFESRETWEQARKTCQAHGGDLACLETEAEQRLVQALAAGQDVWIGGSDADKEDVWKWITGDEFTYTNWAAGEPSDSSGGEDSLEMWPNGEWNDQPAHDRQPFICEWHH
jgi:hypothetical protein